MRARASECRILRKRWRGKLQPSMIVRPSCPPVPTPRPLRAKRCVSFRALSTNVKGENSQLQLIPSCRAIRPAFAEARGQTLKFRGAPASEAAPDRAAIVPHKSAKSREDESALLRRAGIRAGNLEASPPNRPQLRSVLFQPERD